MSVPQPIDLQSRMEYSAEVINRVTHNDLEITDSGARIYTELVTFKDQFGTDVTRELTIAEPSSELSYVSPYPIVETDPWTTGAEGFNRDRIRQYAKLGFPVLWLHHAGRYSQIARNKSINRSAGQMHALLDEFRDNAEFETNQVLVGGYSRGAMTAEKFIATSARHNRSVAFSDTEAPCFVRDMSTIEKIETLARQIPQEIIGLGQVALKLVERSIAEEKPELLTEYLRTIDLHPRNVAHEIMWAKALVNSSVGHSVATLPKETVGLRTFFAKDVMSQQHAYTNLYKDFPGITVLTEKGPHLAGALPEYQDKKQNRFDAVMRYMAEHNMLLDGITTDYVLENQNDYSVNGVSHHYYTTRASA